MFREARDWGRFHTPKNLAMALSVEVAEVVEHFQWSTAEESADLSPEKTEAVKGEIADVFIYLVALADRLGIDPVAAAHEKVALNELRYPAQKSRGRADKYTEY